MYFVLPIDLVTAGFTSWNVWCFGGHVSCDSQQRLAASTWMHHWFDFVCDYFITWKL